MLNKKFLRVIIIKRVHFLCDLNIKHLYKHSLDHFFSLQFLFFFKKKFLFNLPTMWRWQQIGVCSPQKK